MSALEPKFKETLARIDNKYGQSIKTARIADHRIICDHILAYDEDDNELRDHLLTIKALSLSDGLDQNRDTIRCSLDQIIPTYSLIINNLLDEEDPNEEKFYRARTGCAYVAFAAHLVLREIQPDFATQIIYGCAFDQSIYQDFINGSETVQQFEHFWLTTAKGEFLYDNSNFNNNPNGEDHHYIPFLPFAVCKKTLAKKLHWRRASTKLKVHYMTDFRQNLENYLKSVKID